MSISINNTISINDAHDEFTIGSILTTDGAFTADSAKIDVYYFSSEDSYEDFTADISYSVDVGIASTNTLEETTINVSDFNQGWPIYQDGVYNFKVTFYDGETDESKTNGKFIDYTIRGVVKFNTLELGNDIDVPSVKYTNYYKGELLESLLTSLALNANVANAQNSLKILGFLQKTTKYYNIE